MSSKLKVQELRNTLAKKGLDTSGSKSVLVARLDAAVAHDQNGSSDGKTAKKRAADVLAADDGTIRDLRPSKRSKNDDKEETTTNKDIGRMTVTELRSALAKEGLSTVGNKNTLHSRLLEVINANTTADDAKADNEEHDMEEAISREDINRLSVAELRSALAERGLSTVGNKKSLQGRLLEAINSSQTLGDVKADEEEDDGEEDDKEENIVVSTKKGSAVLDLHLPDFVKSGFHVLETSEGILDAMLNQTNVSGNNNKFYVIQALEADNGHEYYVYNRWGRVGVKGQDKLFGPFTLSKAELEFKSKFYEKTLNQWTERHNFEAAPNKYTWLERDYSDEVTNKSEAKANKKEEKPKAVTKTPEESKLDSRLAQFITLICNVKMMKQQMMEIGYDANKMPLGKLSKATILKGYESLKKIAAVLQGSAQGSLEKLSSDFYTVIPHDFGFQKMRNFIIDTQPKLKRKLEMVEALGEIEVATKLLESGGEDEDDPVYTHYEKLNCSLEPLEHNSEEFGWIKEYTCNTHAATHTSYKLELLHVFKSRRAADEDRFKKFSKTKNRMLLWHGSRLTNWTGILSQGLRIAPPEAPSTGYMFGKGVYFADMVSKSANYCYTSPRDSIGVLLLCEVALGEMNELISANYDAGKLPKGKLSTMGVGSTHPDPKQSKVLSDGVIVPIGKPIEKPGEQSSLLYNEYIVYDVAQIRMRYVLHVNFKYKY